MNEAYIIEAIRLPRALCKKEGGAYAKNKPVELLATLFQEIEHRHPSVLPNIDDVILGCSTQSGSQGSNIAKIASLYAGWPETITGKTISSFCCSGLDAINYAATKIFAGAEDLVIAGGVEHISSAPMFSDKGPWFADPEVAKKTGFIHMGLSADLIACEQNYSRDQLNTLSVESHRRALRAQEEKRFEKSVVPLHINYLQEKQTSLANDDAVRHCDSNQLEKLQPSFSEMIEQFRPLVEAKYPHIDFLAKHSAANSPALVDGASMLLLASKDACSKYNLKPRAKIVSYASASDEPIKMLTGHIRATEKLLLQQGISANDIDLWEVNESFAATVLLFQSSFGITSEKLNVNGGAIALGHPLGATGGNLVSMLIDELERSDKKLGVVSICGAAGLGTSTLIERMN